MLPGAGQLSSIIIRRSCHSAQSAFSVDCAQFAFLEINSIEPVFVGGWSGWMDGKQITPTRNRFQVFIRLLLVMGLVLQSGVIPAVQQQVPHITSRASVKLSHSRLEVARPEPTNSI
jgi:hypothetical protein